MPPKKGKFAARICQAATSKQGARSASIAKPRGKAIALGGAQWPAWCEHLKKVGPTWLYVQQKIQELLTCRETEVLKLRGSDFDTVASTVTVGKLKRGEERKKVMLPQLKDFVTSLKEEGLNVSRKKWEIQGETARDDTFVWTDGLLFHGRFKKTRHKPMDKKTVEAAIRRARESFDCPGLPVADKGRLRSHSARHHSIKKMRSSGVADEDGMFQARIKKPEVYMGYGKKDDSECRAALLGNEALLNASASEYGPSQASVQPAPPSCSTSAGELTRQEARGLETPPKRTCAAGLAVPSPATSTTRFSTTPQSSHRFSEAAESPSALQGPQSGTGNKTDEMLAAELDVRLRNHGLTIEHVPQNRAEIDQLLRELGYTSIIDRLKITDLAMRYNQM